MLFRSMTGVSLMVLDEGVDTGPVMAVIESAIQDDETGGSLTARLSHLGADLLSGALPEYLVGDRDPAPPIEAGASHARRLTTTEAAIDPMAGAEGRTSGGGGRGGCGGRGCVSGTRSRR